MDQSEAKKRIDELKEEIALHNQAYYMEDAPKISDYQYDQLMVELIALEEAFPQLITADSPTQRVGGAVGASFASVHHQQPLLSLENAFDADDLASFIARFAKAGIIDPEFVVEPKLDGLSLSVLIGAAGLLQLLPAAVGASEKMSPPMPSKSLLSPRQSSRVSI